MAGLRTSRPAIGCGCEVRTRGLSGAIVTAPNNAGDISGQKADGPAFCCQPLRGGKCAKRVLASNPAVTSKLWYASIILRSQFVDVHVRFGTIDVRESTWPDL